MLGNHHEFLTRDQVRMNVDPTMTEMTFAAGYAADWISVDARDPRHYRAQPYHLLSRLSTDMTGLDNKPYSLKHNLILPAGADTLGEEYRGQKLESLEGVSGSGLWQRTGFNDALVPKKGLVGIVIEHKRIAQKIVGTRIDVFIEVLIQTHDISMPRSSTIRIQDFSIEPFN